MKIKHDRKADAIYMKLTNMPYAYGKDLDNERRVDYDIDDSVRGIELLCVSTGVITDDLPNRTEVERALGDRGIKIYA